MSAERGGPTTDPDAHWKKIEPPQQMAMMGFPVKAFQRNVEDGHLTVFAAKEPTGAGGELRWHMSVSHTSNLILNRAGGSMAKRLPTWDEIKDARYRFLPKYATIALLLPPPEEYVNQHPTVMHLHQIEAI